MYAYQLAGGKLIYLKHQRSFHASLLYITLRSTHFYCQLPATINDGIEPLCLPACICQCLSEALFSFYVELTFRVHRLVPMRDESRGRALRPRPRFCPPTVLQSVLSKKMNPFQLSITRVFSYLHVTSLFLIIPRKKRIAIVLLSETPENQNFPTARVGKV
jgi:hypothetical protein